MGPTRRPGRCFPDHFRNSLTGVKAGAVARFTVVRERKASTGEGHLVAVGSNGALARRAVVLASRSASAGDDLDEVILRAWRLWPWRDQFQVDAVAVESKSVIIDDGPVALVSTEADVAQVTFSDGAFTATDLDKVGEYTGTADLRPGEDGGDLTAKVLAKDIWIWPLTTLLLGLGVVSLINQYTRRDRPADLLRVRLARLLSTVSTKEEASLQHLRKNLPRLNPVVPRIRGQGDESLLMDSEVKAALDDWSNALHDTEREEFEPPDGSRWKRLQGYLDTYSALLDQLEDIGDGLTRIRIRPEGHWELAEAPILEPVLALLQAPSGLANADDLRQRKAQADAESPRLQTILEIQKLLLAIRANAPAFRAEAEAQLQRLWRAAGDLATEKASAKDLYDRSQKAATPPSEPPRDFLPVPAGRAPGRPGSRSGWPPERAILRRPRSLAAGGALVLVAALLIAAVFLLGQPNGAVPVRPALDSKEPSALAVNLTGLVVLVVLGVPAVLIVPRLVRKRDRERLRGEDEVSLRQALRWRDTAYACLSGLLVILSGMSLVYAADATFGTPGDYLTILLWGTAVTEGLALAKMLLPSPFS